MKFLVVTQDGFGSALAMKLTREGNAVRLHIGDPEARNIFEGLADKVDDWKQSLAWAECVVFLDNKCVDIWRECVKTKPCYQGSEAGQKLEKDRLFSGKLAKEIGMEVPESLSVKTVAEVEKHLSAHPVKHVLKFTGGTCDSDDVLLGEYDDGRDLLRFCRFIEESGKKWDEIEIQEKIDGLEVGMAGYFDGEKFDKDVELNFQMKRFAAGDGGNGVGFLTGETGTLIRFVTQKNEFYKRTLGAVAPYLKKVGYRGECDIGTIVSPDGKIYFIEFTPRTGVPDYVIQWELRETPVGDLIYQVATGKLTDKNKVRAGWAMGVVVMTPGFPDPDSSEKRSVGLPILGYDGQEDHCALFEARKGKDGLEISEGGYGYPCVMTGRGPTAESAIRRTYWMLNSANTKRVFVPKGWYRSDIGQRVVENKEEFIELGVCTESEWDD